MMRYYQLRRLRNLTRFLNKLKEKNKMNMKGSNPIMK